MSHAFILDGDIYIAGEILNHIIEHEQGNIPNHFIKYEIPVKFVSVSVGDYHISAIDTNGNIWDLGPGNADDFEEDDDGFPYLKEVHNKIEFQQVTSDIFFTNVSCGHLCTFALDNEGSLWVAEDLFGDDYKKNFRRISSNTYFEKMSGGSRFALLLDFDGNLWVSENYQDEIDNFHPIEIPVGVIFRSISCGNNTLAAIDIDNNLWVSGEIAGEIPGFPKTTIHGTYFDGFTIILEGIKSVSCNNGVLSTIDIHGNIWSVGLSPRGSRFDQYQRLNENIDAFQILSRSYKSLLILDVNGKIWTLEKNTSKMSLIMINDVLADTLSDQDSNVKIHMKSARKVDK